MSFSHRLSDSLRRALGEDAAEEFVDWMDQVEARRIEAAEFRETIRGDIAELRHEMRASLERLRLDMNKGFYVLGGVALTNAVLSIAAIVIALFALRR